jgi:ice-binding like protein/putative adhesin/PEP-CTERM motif-containing protein
LTHGIDATVNGRWDYDLTDSDPSASGYTGNVTGGFHQMDLSGVAADARSASATAAAFAPTQVFSSLSEGQNVIGNSGVNVIQITGDSAIKTFLDITGSPSSTFIFQFTSPTTAGHDILTLSGMTMNLMGGVQPGNIYWDFNGPGGDLSINAMSADQTVYGNFLAPDRNITGDHAIVDGRLIGGGSGSSLSIHSGSTISVPEAGTTCLMLLGGALFGLNRFVRRRQS